MALYASTQNQATGLAHLGQLSQFPTELRHIIWDFLLFGSQKNTPQTIFAILRCNRHLYNEVSFYAYQLISHVIVLRSTYKDDWAVRISFGKLQHEWVFEQNSILQNYINAFSRAKVFHPPIQFQVDIHPSSYNDTGRLICLWKKANDLVEMLDQSSHQMPIVHIRLVGRWVEKGVSRHSIRRPHTDMLLNLHDRQYRISHDDHEIVALPFLQLESSFQLPPQLWELLSQEPEEKPHSVLYILNKPREDPGQPVIFDQEEVHNAMVHMEVWMYDAITYLLFTENRAIASPRTQRQR